MDFRPDCFVIPAVADQSRRMTIAVVTALSGLFMAGVVFGYVVVLPVALNFLVGFGGDNFNTQLRAGDYFSFATSLLLASGAQAGGGQRSSGGFSPPRTMRDPAAPISS